jgi:hypothetical protein
MNLTFIGELESGRYKINANSGPSFSYLILILSKVYIAPKTFDFNVC